MGISRNSPWMAVAALAGVFGATGCGAKMAPLLEPETTLAKDEHYTKAEVEAAVLNGLSKKGWTLVDEKPGRVIAEIARTPHQAKIEVDYDEHGWKIERKETTGGLLYRESDDGPEIHKRYNLWVGTLDEEIRSALSFQQVQAKMNPNEPPQTRRAKSSGQENTQPEESTETEENATQNDMK